jgi:hypothetical protein
MHASLLGSGIGLCSLDENPEPAACGRSCRCWRQNEGDQTFARSHYLAIHFRAFFVLRIGFPAAILLAPQNAEYVSTGATMIVRYGPVLSDQHLAELQFRVRGSQSGVHEGQTILADDHKTVIFEPAQAFTPGEQVTIDISSVRLDRQTRFRRLSYTFTVATNQQPGTVASPTASPPSSVPRSAFPGFLTLPQDIPHYRVSTALPEAGEGYIFVAPFYWTKTTIGSYLLILDGKGRIVYYQSVADDLAAFDFKVQPNGLLAYWDQKDSTFHLMDAQYRMVDSYQAGNGYVADLHDFQILPNGNVLLMAYDDETVDMSKVVRGGKKDATVTGLVIQELDPSKNVIFEWRSWDHVSFFDSTVSLTDQKVDLVHGNALALSNDGNLLLSSRNLSEITEIDLQTGEVIWRLGGKANMFERGSWKCEDEGGLAPFSGRMYNKPGSGIGGRARTASKGEIGKGGAGK